MRVVDLIDIENRNRISNIEKYHIFGGEQVFNGDSISGSFKRFLKSLNVGFCFMDVYEDHLLIGVDSVASIPIFYSVSNENGAIYISNNANDIADRMRLSLDKLGIKELLSLGYVTGERTVYSEVKCVQPGHVVTISLKTGRVNDHKYYDFKYEPDDTKSYEEFLVELDELFIDVFKDFIDRNKGKTVLVELSGGCDSRIIAVILKRLGCKNVKCLTLGKTNSPDVKIAKLVASRLGYECLHIEYNRKKMIKKLEAYSKRKKRGDGKTSFVSFPGYLPDEKKQIMDFLGGNIVVVGGHSLDFNAGSWIPCISEEEYWSKRKLIDCISNKHYVINKNIHFEHFYWEKEIPECADRNKVIECLQEWNWKNRQTWFITQCFDQGSNYLDLDYETPFFDYRIMDYFNKVPYDLLFGRKLQYLYMDKYVDSFLKLTYDERARLGGIVSDRKKRLMEIKYLGRLLYLYKIYIGDRKNSSMGYNEFMSIPKFIIHKLKHGEKCDINTVHTIEYVNWLTRMVAK